MAFLLTLIVVLFMTITRYTIISKFRSKYTFRDLLKKEELNEISEVEMWWNYKIAGSSPVINNEANHKMKGRENKIILYAKLKSDHKELFIYETLHFSSYFPNGVEYRLYEKEKGMKYFKVWSVDSCLEKLGIDVK